MHFMLDDESILEERKKKSLFNIYPNIHNKIRKKLIMIIIFVSIVISGSQLVFITALFHYPFHISFAHRWSQFSLGDIT